MTKGHKHSRPGDLFRFRVFAEDDGVHVVIKGRLAEHLKRVLDDHRSQGGWCGTPRSSGARTREV